MTVSRARFLLVAASLLALAGCTPSTPAEPEATATPTERRTMSRAEYFDAMDETLEGPEFDGDHDYEAFARTVCGDYETLLNAGRTSNEAFNELVATLASNESLAEVLDIGQFIKLTAWAVLYECPELAEDADLDG